MSKTVDKIKGAVGDAADAVKGVVASAAQALTPTDVNVLNSLLRGEISAVETYEQAIPKFDDLKVRPMASILTRIRDEHDRAVGVLKGRVTVHGGTPSEGAGLWGAFANAVAGTAKLIGPQTVLAALKQGELHGIGEYEQAVQNENVSAAAQELIRTDLLAGCRDHVVTLERLIGQLEAQSA